MSSNIPYERTRNFMRAPVRRDVSPCSLDCGIILTFVTPSQRAGSFRVERILRILLRGCLANLKCARAALQAEPACEF
jgi:hypothetical protein